eukprot:UN02035
MSEQKPLIKKPLQFRKYPTPKGWYEAMTCVIKRGMHEIVDKGPHKYDALYRVAKTYRYIGSKNELVQFLHDTEPPPKYHWFYRFCLNVGDRHGCPIAYWPEDELKRMNKGKYKKSK